MINRNNIGVTLRRKPKTNLKGLLLLYEKNFNLLKEIIPKIKLDRSFSFLLPEGIDNCRVDINLFKESQYTSKIEIEQKSSYLKNITEVRFEVFVYHDVRMAEVRKFNGKQLFWARNKYPNKNMFHKDEKYQWNKFLLEWLKFSKKEGLSKKIFIFNALK